MTTIGASLGGAPAQGVAPGGRTEWRGLSPGARTAVDWNDPRYATPKPGPKQHYGRHVTPKVEDVPQLPERNIRVRGRAPATYYTLEGVPIPADQWVTLPISPGLIQAVKDGDLERGEDPADEPAQQQRRPRHQTQTPPPTQAPKA